MPEERYEADRPLVSVVVPVYNEEACLPELYRRLTATLASINGTYELIFVNDGSRDNSLAILRELAHDDPCVGFVSFSRNFGHESATSCGLHRAKGRVVVLMDADLQDPPDLIHSMLEQWRSGFDVVFGRRRSRAGETWFTKATSHLFYRVYRQLSPTPMPVDTGDFRLMDRSVVEAFLKMGERARFVRGMLSWTGFSQTELLYDRDARHAGETKYHFWKRLNLAVDAITAATVQPLRYVGFLGAITLLACGATSIVMLAMMILGTNIGGMAWLALAVFFLSGVQLSALGLIAEYVGRTYLESQGRPLYIVAEEFPVGAVGDREERRYSAAA